MNTGTLLKSTVQGMVFINAGDNLDIHSDFNVTGGIKFNQDLSQPVADALAASACATNLGLNPTQTLGNVSTSTTINITGTLNVINVQSVNMVKQTLTINGGAGPKVVVVRPKSFPAAVC